MTIGLIGEHPNDSDSIINVLKRIYSNNFVFIPLLRNIHGSMLESQRTKRNLRIEWESYKPDITIFVRDLDGLETDVEKIKFKKEYFSEFNSVINKTGILLLAIFELETLIFYDLENFNKIYNSTILYKDDPMKLEEPKEYLKQNCKILKYDESDNSIVFEQLDIDKIKKCRFLDIFLKKLDKKLLEFE